MSGKLAHIVLTAVIAAVVAFAVGQFRAREMSAPDTPSVKAAETTYGRVMRTQTIRCGYINWPPSLIVDPTTKQISGVFHDLTEEVGRRLSLHIDWAGETSWATAIDDLKSGKFDMICSHLLATSGRAAGADFTAPIHFMKLSVWVREGDTRFDGNIGKLNDPQYKIFQVDGGAEVKLIERNFPKAAIVSVPQTASEAEYGMALVSKKADAVLLDDVTGQSFLKNNPHTIRRVSGNSQVSVSPNVMLVPVNAYPFKAMIDNAIRELQYDGTLNQIMVRYGAENDFDMIAPPYQNEK